jgi:hypothetical protein
MAAIRLHGPALIIARATWIAIAILTLGLYAASMRVEMRELATLCPPGVCQHGSSQVSPAAQRAFADLHLSVSFFSDYFLGLNIVFTLGFAAIATFLFWRRSRDLLALSISLALLIFGAASFESEMLPLRLPGSVWQLPVGFLGVLGVAGFGAFLYAFPDGRFVPRWTLLTAGAWALWMFPVYFVPDSPFSFSTWAAVPYLGAWAFFLGTFVCAQVYRYRYVSSPMQRVQTKWVVLGIAAAAAGHFGGMLILSVQPVPPTAPLVVLADLVGTTLDYVSVLLVPICIGIAMLRHRLFDVDLVIRRALVYAALACILAFVYEGGVVVMQRVLLMLTGESGFAAEILAAFGAGALAGYAHRYLDRGVTRVIYPRKYEAERRIEAFGKQIRREFDVVTVAERFAAMVEQRLGRLGTGYLLPLGRVADRAEPHERPTHMPQPVRRSGRDPWLVLIQHPLPPP